MPDTTQILNHLWRRWHTLPLGKWMFSFMLGIMVPYTGSIRAKVMEIRPGYAEVHLKQGRRTSNHLNSIHAVALANLIELTGNLALLSTLPSDARFIVKGLCIEYLKKARGTVIARCTCKPVSSSEKQEYVVLIEVYDADGECTTTGKMTTLVGPKS